MSEENDFITWQGGECPVDTDTLVQVLISCKDGTVTAEAGSFTWQRTNYAGDIIAYRVVEAPKPKVEIPEGFTSCVGGTLSLPDKVIVEFMDSTGLMRLRRASDIRWYNNILFYRVLEEFDASKAFSGATSWSGGSNPVPEHIEVGVLLRKGDVVSNAAHRFTWEHHGSSMDIMAYKRLDGNPLSALQREGFLHWNGGECPVPAGTEIDVVLRNGSQSSGLAGGHRWTHGQNLGDIIAYRVIEGEKPKAQTARDIQIGGDHYKKSTVQPWDVVDTWPIEQQIGWYRGNALKYVMRMGTKDENLREIRKAAHYLQKLAEVLEQKGGV